MFQTHNETPNFERSHLAGSKHGGEKSLVLFSEWWQWQVQKMFPNSQIVAKNPDMLFNLVSLPLLKMNWLLMYKKLHTPLNSTKLQILQLKSSMTGTSVFSQRNYAKLLHYILWYPVCWSLYSWWSSWSFFRVCEGSWMRL